MRDFKFRAWDKENKEWLRGGHLVSCILHDSKRITVVGTGKGDYDEWEYPSEVDIQQYTGLKDKNGKEVYEGDILEDTYNIFEVVWVEKDAKFKLRHRGRFIEYPEWNRGVTMEVIGNIYENQELLQ
jgi:uncharacterized phage protein (TIGR01671 family)